MSATTKKLFVKSSLLSKVGKYFWWFCIVIINISFGIIKYFLSNSQSNIFGFSTIFVISSNKFSFKLILSFFLFDNFINSFEINDFLFS